MKKKIFLVDEPRGEFKAALSLVIAGSSKFRVVGEYVSGEECFKDILKLSPDIVITGLDLVGQTGIELTQMIKEKFPHVEVLVISDYDDNQTVFASLKAGASGYLLRTANYIEILIALEELVEGGAPLSRKIARMLVEELHINLNSVISKRERQVMQMMASGLTYSEISDELNISKQTSKTHIRNIYAKLKVNSKSEAISKAREERLI